MAATLSANPWVKRVVQVRRIYGKSAGDTVEINCEYRAPMALVAIPKAKTQRHPWTDDNIRQYILVDSEGTRLPDPPGAKAPDIMFSDGKVNLRIIEGVGAEPPAKPGLAWAGADLRGGLDLAGLLYGRDFTEEIYRVDVSNFGGRKNARDPQFVLVTKSRSTIYWGEPVNATFHAELTPAEKLQFLANNRRKYGQVDAKHSWLDIRFEGGRYPVEERPIASSGNQD